MGRRHWRAASGVAYGARPTHTALLALALLMTCPGVAGQCYLEDSASECAVCWQTTFSAPGDSVGVTNMFPCPDEVAETWLELPPHMTNMQAYPVTFSLKIDTLKVAVVKHGHHVPHANIHSCVAEKGACTPFVANTPGLSTHTPAQKGLMDASGRALFSTEVQLAPGNFILIAHARFFVNNSQDASLPNTKFDVAIGATRSVTRVRKKCDNGAFNEREDVCRDCPPGSFNNGGEAGEHVCFECKDLPGNQSLSAAAVAHAMIPALRFVAILAAASQT